MMKNDWEQFTNELKCKTSLTLLVMVGLKKNCKI